ncbi:hypothetical protein BKI52_42775 [marine bacterium AO1-C]|nr:hypothetical protein BKI52_42775 [marine bacterium AO1-C]
MMNTYIVFGTIILIIIYWPYHLFLYPIFNHFKRQKKQQRIIKNGVPIEGEIIESQYIGNPQKNGRQRIQIIVAFNNFVGTRIQEKFRFFDAQPQQKRYEVGNSLKLSLSKDAIGDKKVSLVDARSQANFKTFAIFLALFFVSVYSLYTFIVQPLWVMGGQDLYTTIALFQNKTSITLIFWFTVAAFFLYFLFRYLKNASGMKGNRGDFKYYGKRSIGHITQYTGGNIRYNRKLQVRFDIAYTTDDGQKVNTSIEKFVSEFEIGRIHEMNHIDILYLPDNPQKVQLTEEPLFGNRLSGVTISRELHFLLFIFSLVIMIATFINVLWPLTQNLFFGISGLSLLYRVYLKV